MSTERIIWNYLIGFGLTESGAAGLMGNLYAESGLIPGRVEMLCLRRLSECGKKYNDATYTAAVDCGKISRQEFLNPIHGKQYGYGIAQWTSSSRKAGLYDLAKARGVSIADLQVQLDYLMQELNRYYTYVLDVLKKANTVREASDIVLKRFECPADTGEAVQEARARYGQKYYDMFKEDKTMTKIEKAVQQMETWAEDNSHGYDQVYRWGEKGDYDCSAAVIQAWENAGVPVKSNGATYTGNMLSVFKKCGFKDVTASVNRTTGAGLKRGDILLNEMHHVAMYCGSGKEVEASINERGKTTGGKPGDQTGKEFLIRAYRNYPWDCVLRFNEEEKTEMKECSVTLHELSSGSAGAEVKNLQRLLNKHEMKGKNGAALVEDGDFGANTEYAVMHFQKRFGLKISRKGTVGARTWSALLRN